MFDAISPNDRQLGSMFDQAKNSVNRTAPGAEDAKQQAEICSVSLTCKIICSYEMCSRLEIASNIERKKIGLNVRRNGPQPSISVRSFSPITSWRRKNCGGFGAFTSWSSGCRLNFLTGALVLLC